LNGTNKPRAARRLIERPRLTRLLDASGERTILLHAPAGYGKTTLARQWTATLSRAVWLSMTPAHRDVAAVAHDLAAQLGPERFSFLDEYLRTRTNPQRAAREIAGALAAKLEGARILWIVLDDYQEITDSPETEEMIEVLRDETTARFLVSSRDRPRWANARRELYGDLIEIGRDTLAMDAEESMELLGRRGDPAVRPFLAQAQGWPAVLALAATPLAPRLPTGEIVPDELHRYLAEELYQSVSPDLRAHLVEIALLPDMSRQALETRFGDQAAAVVEAARELGFVSTSADLELHPLLREFLLRKLLEHPRADARVRQAVEICIAAESWDRALELVLRFSLVDLVEPLLESAYKPLLRAGRLGTLAHFAGRLGSRPAFSSPGVELIDAEVALRDGAYALACDLALRVRRKLPHQHARRSRASAIVGNCGFMLADFVLSEDAFESALADAVDERDQADALFGLARAPIFDERPNIAASVAALAALRERSPIDLVRHAGIVLNVSRIGPGFSRLDAFEEAMHALPHVEDPLVRTGFTANYSYALGIQAKYQRAYEVACLLRDDVEAFDLEFARPHAHWNLAFASLGLRRFGEAERHLQLVEDSVKQRHHGHHALNARALRARMLLQLAQPEEALEYVRFDTHDAAAPSMQAEYLATRGLVLACLGRTDDALAAAEAAERRSVSCEVRVFAAAARSTLAGRVQDVQGASSVVELASRLQVFDPLVVALRSNQPLADLLATQEELRPILQDLYAASNDLALSRRAGIRNRSGRMPSEILSPREFEVLGLMARGLRNKEIASALVIAESTTKVHVRHVFEKLGVRTRTEAAARYQMF
jgi:ATP/maltotriose-dependent transcriptional regulator MalT